ncbi:ArsR/SmtB family transcription factor [Dinoroseobacter sp. S124A]|uniref:ArsR/SmtB family transcription factor n=1 Tax=Dinoroseobacter sp. S124A TaxID=3415128 RepID=UPI003C7C84A5
METSESPPRLAPTRLDAAAAFAALGAPQRLGVLEVLVRAGPEGLPIGVLGERAGVTGSTLTHHVKALVQARLVTQTREGRIMRCTVAYGRVEALSDYLLAQCCADTTTGHDHGRDLDTAS